MKTHRLICAAAVSLTLSAFSASAQMPKPERPESGHEYALSFDYDGVPVTAVTTVPSAPEDVSFSATKIEVMGFQPPQSMSKAPGGGIEISWKNDEGEYYIVEGRTSSTNPVTDVEEDEDMPAKSFKLNYTQGTSATLSSSDFNYYGHTISPSSIPIRNMR